MINNSNENHDCVDLGSLALFWVLNSWFDEETANWGMIDDPSSIGLKLALYMLLVGNISIMI